MDEKKFQQTIKKFANFNLSEENKKEIFDLIETKINFEDQKKYQFRLANFSFLSQYRKSLVLSAVLIFAVGSLAFAQNSLPNSPLYPLKVAYQDDKIFLAGKDDRAQVRAIVLEERLNDLKQVESSDNPRVNKVVKKIENDLKVLPAEISQAEKKQTVLNVSQSVKERTDKIQQELPQINALKDNKQLEETIQETNQKLLGMILETTEEINQCPSTIQQRLETLNTYFSQPENMNNLTISEITKINSLLKEANQILKAGDCLGALEKIESLDLLKSIHSLEIPSVSLEVEGEESVENNSPENLDEN